MLNKSHIKFYLQIFKLSALELFLMVGQLILLINCFLNGKLSEI